MAVAKNHLDNTYSMNVDSSFNLSNCREYCNIDVCGDQLYMTYRDNIDYKCLSVGDAISVGLSGSPKEILPLDMEMVENRKPYGYQHIEVVHSWNRFDNSIAGGHKSSMFSLKLIDTGLNESTINEQAKQKLRQNVQKNVRSLIESLTPANC